MRVMLHELLCHYPDESASQREYMIHLVISRPTQTEIAWTSWAEVFSKPVAEMDLESALFIADKDRISGIRIILQSTNARFAVLRSLALNASEYKQAKDRLLAEQPEQPLPKRRLELQQ